MCNSIFHSHRNELFLVSSFKISIQWKKWVIPFLCWSSGDRVTGGHTWTFDYKSNNVAKDYVMFIFLEVKPLRILINSRSWFTLTGICCLKRNCNSKISWDKIKVSPIVHMLSFIGNIYSLTYLPRIVVHIYMYVHGK